MQQVQQASAGEDAAKSSKQVLVNQWATWSVSKRPPVGPHGEKPPIVTKIRWFSRRKTADCPKNTIVLLQKNPECCVKAKIKVTIVLMFMPNIFPQVKICWDHWQDPVMSLLTG